MNSPVAAPLDAETELKFCLAEQSLPRPDMGRITMLLQEMQRQVAALEAHTLSATRGNSLDSALSHGGHAVIAAEAAAMCLLGLSRELGTLRTTCQAAEAGMRLAIGAAMESTGVLLFPLEFHNIEAAAGAVRVEVHAPEKLPSQFWRHSEPEPDKPRIAAALKHGPVAGARGKPGPRTIRITKRKGMGE